MNIDRDVAVDLLNKYVITEHIKTHSHAVEAVMRAPAKRLAPDHVDLWGISGQENIECKGKINSQKNGRDPFCRRCQPRGDVGYRKYRDRIRRFCKTFS